VSPREVLEALRRRWYVVVAGLLLTALTGWLVTHPQPTYRAVTVIALQPPQTPVHPNRLLDLRPSIALTAAMVTQQLKSRSGDAQMRSDGVIGDYALAPRNSGTTQTPAYAIPSVEASVIAHDQEGTVRSVDVIVAAFRDALGDLQRQWEVPATDRITVVTLAPPNALLLPVVKTRALLGVGLIGAAVTAMASIWLDHVVARRRRDARWAG
jgi:hypothetical protein